MSDCLLEIDQMFQELEKAPPIVQPSQFWKVFNQKNRNQLQKYGIDNIRNTLSCNYFTWVPLPKEHRRFLNANVSFYQRGLNIYQALCAANSSSISKVLKKINWSKKTYARHAYETLTLFDYVKKRDSKGLLKQLIDSPIGTPPPIFQKGTLVTADLANSLLEYYSIIDSIDAPVARLRNIAELGAGYGRNAALFLQLHPYARYIICDIPPALYVAQTYLTKRFPERKSFLFRPFQNFADVQQEWEESSMCFLLPHQMSLLPAKSVDLFINISSLHEMTYDQIRFYFEQIDRLVHGYFYMKQWQVHCNPYDRITIQEKDYPIYPNWSCIYSRPCAVQTSFFERLLSIPAR